MLKPPSTWTTSPEIPAERIGAQECRRVTHIFNSNGTANRGNGFAMSQHLRKSLIPEAARVRIGPAEMALTRTPSGPHRVRHIAHVRFQRRFCQTHNVVVRDSALSAKVGKGQQGRTRIQHGAASFCHCNEAVGADVVGNFEAFTGNGVNIVTIQLIARCKTNRVYETVKFRPNFPSSANMVSMLASSATSHCRTMSEPN